MASTINASTSGGIIQTADTSGILELQSGGSTKLTVASTGAYGSLKSSVAQTAAGTAVNFPDLSPWVKRITVMFSGVKTSGTSSVIIQIGDSGGVEATGYNGVTLNSQGTGVVTTPHTTGVLQDSASASTYLRHGVLYFLNLTGNTWAYQGSIGNSETGRSNNISGSKTLSDVLTQIRITTASPGTDTFTAGTINIMYEG